MTITFATIFDDIIKDLDSFFIEGYSSNITTNYTVQGKFIARAKGSGKERELLMPSFSANTEITDLKNLIVAHFIAGHEIAHLINDHNKPSPRSDEDLAALEKWADYFGARLAFTILIFGKLSSGQLKSYAGPFATANAVPFDMWSQLLLQGAREAIDFLYNFFPNEATEHHPGACFRVQTIVAGVLSFFSRYYNDVDKNITLGIINCLLLSQKWFDSNSLEFTKQNVEDAQFRHIGVVHERIQAESSEITAGLDPFFERLIGTSYNFSPEALENRKESFAKNFDKWGDHFGNAAAIFARSL